MRQKVECKHLVAILLKWMEFTNVNYHGNQSLGLGM
jgi:hypothetical protein